MSKPFQLTEAVACIHAVQTTSSIARSPGWSIIKVPNSSRRKHVHKPTIIALILHVASTSCLPFRTRGNKLNSNNCSWTHTAVYAQLARINKRWHRWNTTINMQPLLGFSHVALQIFNYSACLLYHPPSFSMSQHRLLTDIKEWLREHNPALWPSNPNRE